MFGVRQQSKGLTLVEMLIAVAVFVTIFTGLFSIVLYTSKLVLNSSMKLAALSLANERMEYFRSLPYDSVGTIAGIPAGSIPQNSTTTLNGAVFYERVLVEYVDDPADGLLTATTTDSNGIPNDYKRIKVEVSWNINSQVNGSIFLVSNIVPRSIETTIGGGTVRISVLDADASLLPGATVRLINASTTPPIDITRFSDANGVALISGAPAASNYQVIVTAPGFSTDQTYVATVANPSPITASFAVLEADISTLAFQIGALSDITVRTLSNLVEQEVSELFTTAASIVEQTDTAVNGGTLTLAGAPGSYAPYGIAFLEAITPSAITEWKRIVVVSPETPSTQYRIQLYTGAPGSYTLIPDTDLPGNGAGFSDAIINIEMLDAATYPSITPVVMLDSNDVAVTPLIDELSVYYRASETPRSGTTLTLRGNKVIGSDSGGAPIPKFTTTVTTDGGGSAMIPDVEFDTYSVTTASLVVAHVCGSLPLIHKAGVDSLLELLLIAAGEHTLRVAVVDAAGSPLPGATVTVSRPSYNETIKTNSCGQAFFDTGFSEGTEFTITTTRPGYDTVTITGYPVTDMNSTTVVLTEQ